MTLKKLQTYSFIVILILGLILALAILRPYLGLLAFALILVILFQPLHRYLLRRVKSNTWAAIITVSIMVLIVLVPLFFFGQLLYNELVNIYQNFKTGGLVLHKNDIMQSLPPQVQDFVTTLSSDVNALVNRFASGAFATFSGLVSNIAGFILSFFLLFFSVFFFFRDGEKIKSVLVKVSPLATAQENVLFDKIASAVNGVVKGAFLVALIQGLVATVGFFIFGIPEPILWGLFTVMAALVPTVGTSLSLIPAVAYLLITGHIGAAVGLAIWGILAVGLIDNIVGPYLVGSRTNLHPLLVLFSVLGGIQLFGFMGFLLGPIIMAIFVALVGIYNTDFKSKLEN